MLSRYWKGTLFVSAAVGMVLGWWFLMNRDHAEYWGQGHMMGSSDWGWAMAILMILIWALVIWGVIWFVRSLGRPDGTSAGGTTALDVLKKRYAAGEITREEFEATKRDLI